MPIKQRAFCYLLVQMFHLFKNKRQIAQCTANYSTTPRAILTQSPQNEQMESCLLLPHAKVQKLLFLSATAQKIQETISRLGRNEGNICNMVTINTNRQNIVSPALYQLFSVKLQPGKTNSMYV